VNSVGVVGLGHVGRNVVERLTAVGVDVVSYDRQSGAEYPEARLAQCSFLVVCVGTPGLPDGRPDLEDVYDAVTLAPCRRILLRSTVPPGTTDALAKETGKDVCFSPEYFGETVFSQNRWQRWAGDDLFQVLGGPAEVTSWFAGALTSIYGPEPRMFQCTATEAEIAKYLENSYFAVKVTFVNEFYELCLRAGADWHTVREAWLLDPRVERDHTAVFAESRGFGGRCLPKDVDAILEVADELGVDLSVLRATRDANAKYLDRRV